MRTYTDHHARGRRQTVYVRPRASQDIPDSQVRVCVLSAAGCTQMHIMSRGVSRFMIGVQDKVQACQVSISLFILHLHQAGEVLAVILLRIVFDFPGFIEVLHAVNESRN